MYYAGLGFDRSSPNNTVTVNKGTFDSSGQLTWGPPVFINQTTAPSTLNDKEWIGVDSNASSPFHDRVYVTWTRFIFNPSTGAYVQSPIFISISSDGGQTFSTPTQISQNVKYDQGSRPIIAPDGTVYGISEGATRLATLDSTLILKSTDGGEKRINCLELGNYINNARLDYYVTNIKTGDVQEVSGHPINTRNGFGGGFIGDYTDIAVGSDNVYHAFWTDTNNQQDVVWFYGFEFVPTPINQEDVVTAAGTLP